MFENVNPDTRHMLDELKNVMLLILTVMDLVLIFLSTLYSFSFRVENLFADYDFLVCLLLFIDLLYDYYVYDGSLYDFLFKDKNILSLISLFPFDLLLRYFSIFRLFRILKLIKIVRVYHVVKDFESVEYFIQHHLFKSLLVILAVYIGVSSVLLLIFDDSFNALGDAFWFIAITASTVGYGDLVPVSPIGKSFALLSILIGIIFVAIFTAYLSSVYNEGPERQTRDTIIKHVRYVEKGTKITHREIGLLKDRIDTLEEENKQLNEKLDSMNNTLEEILENQKK